MDSDPLSPVPLSLSKGEQLQGALAIYEVEEPLGSGGMAIVYRVHSVRGSAKYAAKFLSSERFAITDTVRDRFLRESGLAQEFDSPRVVRSIETVRHRGTLVSIMELLTGRTLYDVLLEPRARVSPRKRIEWLMHVTEGIAYLHERDIVHRDLSPRNCLFREDGSLAVGDFGVARRADDPTMTTLHERMGSLLYISPQQRESPHSASFSDDVFALGQIAYHVLTGRSPHGGVERVVDLGYPNALDGWVRNLRDQNPQRRPESAVDCLWSLVALKNDRADLPRRLPEENV